MNNFHGTVPQTFMRGIKMIDLSQNQLHGGLPLSLSNCTMLEILVLGDNQIEDTFSFLLGTLPQLEVLVLRSNRFHGAIENPNTNLKFPKLRIIDLSHNGFSGTLPSKYFRNWNAMKVVAKGNSTYMQVEEKPGAIEKAKYVKTCLCSYGGNMALCGAPLTLLCENSETSPLPPLPHSSQGDDSEFSRGIYWIVIIIGYGSGLIVGLVIGQTLTTRHHEWAYGAFGKDLE
ncbi:receptor-like protein 20 [Rhododendron vialii]|uniref:receptor-like protein 20 n=1 Tax=Rhododendron vialii TaxID=182163 RepID=UPI00265EC4B4|nr:receptor-like protein 20 [Rhododendron vialii]